MPIAFNHETQQAKMLDQDGQWVPTETTINPETGLPHAWDGAQWQRVYQKEPIDELFPGWTRVTPGDYVQPIFPPTWSGHDNFVDNVLFGFGDNLKAASTVTENALAGFFDPEYEPVPWDTAYDEALKLYRNAKDRYTRENPASAAATSIAGAVVGGALPGGLITKGVGKTLQAGGISGLARWMMPGLMSGRLGVAAQRAVTSPVIPGMVAGGGVGALHAVGIDDGKDPVGAAISGGTIGTLAPLALDRTGKIMSGVTDPVKKYLLEAGVALTPGQIGGPLARTAEKVVGDLPYLSPVIKSLEARAGESFNQAFANRVLAPIGRKASKDAVGADLLEDVGLKISTEYDRVLPAVKQLLPDEELATDLAAIAQSGSDFKDVVGDAVTRHINQYVQQGIGKGINGRQWLLIDKQLGQLVKTFKSDPHIDYREVGDRLGDAQVALREWLERNADPDILPHVEATNNAWNRFNLMQRAMPTDGTAFTPNQLMSAVRDRSSNLDPQALDPTTVLGRRFAAAGQQVLGRPGGSSELGERVADTGLLASVLAGSVDPTYLAALPGAAMYTRWGNEVLRWLAINRPETLRKMGMGLRENVDVGAAPAAAGAVSATQD